MVYKVSGMLCNGVGSMLFMVSDMSRPKIIPKKGKQVLRVGTSVG